MTDAPPDDFGPVDYDEPAQPSLRLVLPEEDEPAPHLQRNKEGVPKKSMANIMDMLAHHDEWKGVLAYDAFSECVVKTRPPPVRAGDASPRVVAGEWTDADSVRAVAWLGSQPFIGHRLDVGIEMLDRALIAVAEQTIVHPVRDYLKSLEWDGTVRLPDWLETYFGADTSSDPDYVREVGVRWMISAVARVMQPGCQADSMLVFEGKQDAGKSTGIEALCGAPWFADTGVEIGTKDSYQNLRAVWVYEMAELATVRSARDVERVKAFISARADRFRDSYGHRTRDHRRQCVFAGTTNEAHYLTDRTGNRRFWPVRIVGTIDRDAIKRDRDQLWAEAVVRYEQGEKWHLDTEALRQAAREQQLERVMMDPWVGYVRRWLADPTVPDVAGGCRKRIIPTDGIEAEDILTGALQMKPGETTHRHRIQLAHVMEEIGWMGVRERDNSGARIKRYYPTQDALPELGGPEPAPAPAKPVERQLPLPAGRNPKAEQPDPDW